MQWKVEFWFIVEIWVNFLYKSQVPAITLTVFVEMLSDLDLI